MSPIDANDARYVPLTQRALQTRMALRAAPAAILATLALVAVLGGAPSVVIAAAVFVLVAYVATSRGAARKDAARTSAGNAKTAALLLEGRTEDAAAAMDETLVAARGLPPVHAMLLVQRAQLFLRLGDAERARALLRTVRASKWLDDARLAQGASSLASALAMTAIVRGDLDEAAEARDAAHAKIKEADRLQLLPVDALLDARRGRFAETAKTIDDAWADAEKSLAPRALDLVRFVRAFVADALGESPRDPGDADVAYLAVSWPELRDFDARRRLRAAPEGSSIPTP